MDQAKLFLSSFGGGPDPGPSPDPGDPIAASARFTSANYLSRTFGTPTDGALFSLSGWMKPALDNVASDQGGPLISLLATGAGAGSQSTYGFYQTSIACYCNDNSGTNPGNGGFDGGVNNRAQRDPSSWYHFYVAVSSVEPNAEDRVKLYINGVRQTSKIGFNLAANSNVPTNSANREQFVGMFNGNIPSSGYMAAIYFIDGQQLPVETFGRFNENGIWVPVTPSGLTFGNNGYHLDFSDTSNPGKDMSPNGNDWTPTGWDLDPTSDGYSFTADSPTQNFALINPLKTYQGFSCKDYVQDANFRHNNVSQNQPISYSPTIQFPEQDKVFFGVEQISSTSWGMYLGLYNESQLNEDQPDAAAGQLTGLNWNGASWQFFENGVASSGTTWDINDWLYFAYERSAGRVRIWKNDTLVLDNTSAPDDLACFFNVPYNTRSFRYNFGQLPWKHDVNPFDDGAYLVSTNIPSGPIRDGSEHFQAITGAGSVGGLLYSEIYGQEPNPGTVTTNPLTLPLTSLDITYSGQGVNNPSGSGGSGGGNAWQHVWDAGESITTVDITWIYQSGTQTFAYSNDGTTWFGTESSSGQTSITHAPGAPFRYIRRYSNSAGSQQHTADQGIPILGKAQEAFPEGLWWIKDRVNSSTQHLFVDSVRGQVGGNWQAGQCPAAGADVDYVAPTGDSVAWCWSADQSFTDSSGDLTATGLRDVDAGFSIITWTGANGGNQSVAHGLGKPVDFIIGRAWKRPGTSAPSVYVRGMSVPGRMLLNTSDAPTTENWFWQDPDDTLIYVGDETADPYENIAYCWASVPGYSAFGTYTGNGDDDGVFVHCGFRPAFIMYKRTSTAGNWVIHDTTRNINNPATLRLVSNTTDSEGTATTMAVDILSNGFKHRNSDGDLNSNGHTYVYCAFAENPFSGPTTAR